MFDLLRRLFRSQAGQVAVDGGGESDDQGTSETQVAETEGQSAVTELAPLADQTQSAGQQSDPTFLEGSELDPTRLPPEVLPIFKRMQGAYTKRLQAISEIREKAATVDKFYSDPTFAQQTLIGWAAQNGYQLTPVGQQPGQGQQPQQQRQAPPQMVEQVKANLPSELQWMAEPLAGVMGNMFAQVLTPLQQQQQEQIRARANEEYQTQASQLSEKVPHWQEHEDVMSELFDFMTGPQQSHPKFGSKLQMLYDLATSRSASMAAAIGRVSKAGQLRTTTSRTAQRPAIGPDEIAKAKTGHEAFELAKRAALAQHGQKG